MTEISNIDQRIAEFNSILFYYIDMELAIQLRYQLGNERTTFNNLRLRAAQTMIKSYQETLETLQNVRRGKQHQEYLNEIWHSPPNFQLNVESQRQKKTKVISKPKSYTNKLMDLGEKIQLKEDTKIQISLLALNKINQIDQLN